MYVSFTIQFYLYTKKNARGGLGVVSQYLVVSIKEIDDEDCCFAPFFLFLFLVEYGPNLLIEGKGGKANKGGQLELHMVVHLNVDLNWHGIN